MIKVRDVFLLHTEMSLRLPSNRYGKYFGCDYPVPTSSEVWTFYSLSSWVPLFPDVEFIILWRRACLCSGWRFLFKVSLSCFVPLVGRSSCRNGVSHVFHVSSGLAALAIYSTYLSLTVTYWGILVSIRYGYARDYDGFSAFVYFDLCPLLSLLNPFPLSCLIVMTGFLVLIHPLLYSVRWVMVIVQVHMVPWLVFICI